MLRSCAAVAVAAALLLVLAAPSAAKSPRIVGGTQAPAGSYPWQVALINASSTSSYAGQFCGGTLIAPGRVLTAAHCTQGRTPGSLDVLANTTSLASGGERIDVVEIEDHPRSQDPQNGAYRFDVSVLRLDRSATNPRPIALVADGEAELWAPGDALTVTGWGSTVPVDGDPLPGEPPATSDKPSQLREASVPRRTDTNCDTAYPDETPDTFDAIDQFCASPATGGRDTCQGDSGGPIVAPVAGPVEKTDPADWRLVGVTSWGAGCADADFPGVYARLANAEIRSFVDAQVTRTPHNRSAPVLSGTPQVGQTLSCSTGDWDNRPTRYAYRFERVSPGGTVTPVATGASSAYTVTANDLGAELRCRVTAFFRGSGEAVSAAVGPVTDPPPAPAPAPAPAPSPAASVASAPAPTPVATPVATPAPSSTPTPSLRDAVPPQIVSVRRSCGRTRCTLIIRTSDRAPSAGVARIGAALRARVRNRTRTRSLTSRATSSRTFTVRVPRYGRGSYRLTLRAVDRAGNRQRAATIRAYRLSR